MRILRASFASPQEFLDRFEEAQEGAGGSLLHHTRVSLRSGESVLVELEFPGLPGRALLRASVAVPGVAEQGSWLRFAHEDESSLSFALALAQGRAKPLGKVPRSHLRFPLALPVEWGADGSGDRYLTTTEDVGGGGLAVRTFTPPPVGTGITVRIGPLQVGELMLRGQVAWVRTGSDFGMGIRFGAPADVGARRLRQLLRRIAETGKVDLET